MMLVGARAGEGIPSLTRKIIHVDAFADRPFAGNRRQCASSTAPADEGWMQAVAAEMNLSETAFLHPEGGKPRHPIV